MVLGVCCSNGQHHSREATESEQDNKRDTKQHWSFESQRTFIHGSDPVEYFHSRWDSNQHGGVHKVQLARNWHANRKHMVSPNYKRKERNGCCCINH